MMTASALRRDQHNGVYQFPEEVDQLQTYFGPANQQAYVRAYPAVNKNVPLYILDHLLILHMLQLEEDYLMYLQVILHHNR